MALDHIPTENILPHYNGLHTIVYLFVNNCCVGWRMELFILWVGVFHIMVVVLKGIHII